MPNPGRKKCPHCERFVPVAIKVCECGHAFIKNGKKCLKCGSMVPIARKTCDCNYVFKQRIKLGFKEMPIVLTSDRLRPTRPIRTKRPLYNDSDYIYNVAMATLPKQRRDISKNISNGKHDKLGSASTHNELYDKDLNNAALESIANTIVNNNSKSKVKAKIEKLYPKRQRHKSTKYQCYASISNRTLNLYTNKVIKQTWVEQEKLGNSSKTKEEKEQLGNSSKTKEEKEKLGNSSKTKEEKEKPGNTSKSVTFEMVRRNCNTDSPNSSKSNNNSVDKKKNKALDSVKVPDGNGLKSLIRGEVSKAIKGKVINGGVLSPMQSCDNELTLINIKEEKISDDDALNEKVKNNSNVNCEELKETERTICSAENSSYVNRRGRNMEGGVSDDDERTLKEIMHDLNEVSSPSKEEEIEEKTVKKKLGRPRIHPIRPKKPVGRPRKYPAALPRKYRKKYAKKLIKNLEDIVEKEISEDGNDSTDVSELDNSFLKPMKSEITFDKKEIKRGRPKGCKDSKPRKIRNDYIERLIARKVDVDGLIISNTENRKKKTGKCLLSPPSLMSAKKDDRVVNEVLDPEEIARIEKRLDKTNPFIIPESKKELYSTILDEINRRISTQSFQSSLLIQEL